MKAYVSVNFNKRKILENEINSIKNTLIKNKIDFLIFVDNYKFNPEEEQKMMQKAMNDIDECDFLIAETSEKGIGIGIEAGYAKGKNKVVIYLRKNNSEHSTTLSGISDFRIFYKNIEDLELKLNEVLKTDIFSKNL